MSRTHAWRPVFLIALMAAGCGGESRGTEGAAAGTGSPAAAAAAPPQTRNACRLLTVDEIKALEPSIALANVVAEEPAYSECNWEDADGVVLITLKAYWSGGRQQWETWRTAQRLGQETLQRVEGVGPDDVVKQGLVPGLGDAAYFSPLLPSLLLKGDVLLEIALPTVRDPETKFRPLATALLSRI